MPFEFQITRRVEFSDTDMAGIVHFSNYFRYMEAVEHAFFRSIGLSIHTKGFGENIGWPRVHVACDFKRPLRFEDTVEMHLLVREKKERSLVYTIIFRLADDPSAAEVARGTLTVACANYNPATGKMKAVPIPPEISAKIDIAPEELF
jgi:YbgC/YbaW family acyl-CoA thioester hydrolase